MPEKMEERVSFRVTKLLGGQIDAWAAGERRKRAAFCRLLLGWAMERYAEVGTLEDMGIVGMQQMTIVWTLDEVKGGSA